MAESVSATADPELPEVRMHVHRPNEPAVATVARSEPCTNPKAAGFVRHIEFDLTGTDLAGAFRAGQSFGVLPPGTNDKGRPHAPRLYSIASPTMGEDGRGTVLATTVKRTLGEHWDDHTLFAGVASNYLCDLQVGDPVHLSGPNGKRFLLPVDQDQWNYVFFATGTGIAPFRGMLADLFADGTPPPASATLVMGVPYRTDLLYDEHFRRLAETRTEFDYLTAISRETAGQAGCGEYVQDALQSAADRLLPVLSSERTLVYICGIAGMELGILRGLAEHLPPEALARFLTVDPSVEHDRASWTRRMLHKQLKPTRRVFLEVY